MAQRLTADPLAHLRYLGGGEIVPPPIQPKDQKA